MRTLFASTLALALFCVLAGGCSASLNDVLASKDEGTAQSYSVKSDQAWDIAMTVLRWEGCETIEEHRTSGYMLTTMTHSFGSKGTLVGVWIEPVGKTKTKVTVVTKRKVQTTIGTGLTETTFQRRFGQAVDIVKKGKQLPIEAPPDTGE